MIKPTPGRMVWFTPAVDACYPNDPGEPLAAIVARVMTDRLVNLSVIDAHGNHHPESDVPLLQEPHNIRSKDGRYAEWMPYQLGQAAKTEELAKTPRPATAGPVYPHPEYPGVPTPATNTTGQTPLMSGKGEAIGPPATPAPHASARATV